MKLGEREREREREREKREEGRDQHRVSALADRLTPLLSACARGSVQSSSRTLKQGDAQLRKWQCGRRRRHASKIFRRNNLIASPLSCRRYIYILILAAAHPSKKVKTGIPEELFHGQSCVGQHNSFLGGFCPNRNCVSF